MSSTRGLRLAVSRKKVLFIRLDKIGDLICTLPADQILNEEDYDITWIVQKGLGAVVDLGIKKRKYLELDKENVPESRLKLKNLITEIKPDIAISFQGPWWINYELSQAKIPVRSGVYSQWHSFLFLNQGLRQKRSKATQHEYDYNKDLVLKTFGLKGDGEGHYFKINQPPTLNLLERFKLTAKNYIVIHPGMMGSALNWTQNQYIELIQQQIAKNKIICITGTAADDPYLNKIKEKFAEHNQVRWLQSQLNLKELITILAEAEFVVAPSTGVAHLAASVGAKIHGIYSPVRVHHPRRWGPRGPQVTVHVPENVPAGQEAQSMLKLKVEL